MVRFGNVLGSSGSDEKYANGDISIEYTGLRPGEKLYEELLIGENVSGTEHPMIMRAYEHCRLWAEIQQLLADMRGALDSSDCDRARNILAEAVREYTPAEAIHDLIWTRHEESRANGSQVAGGRQIKEATVIPLRAASPS
jgi:FlaA1/EpsC-like NDP-sugar epimerase